MAGTGLGFATVSHFRPLPAIAIVGTLAAALGALAAGVPAAAADALGWPLAACVQTIFAGYALLGIAAGLVYRGLPRALEAVAFVPDVGYAVALLIAGATKIAYDLLLLAGFRHVRPPEEDDDGRSRR